MLHDFLEKNRSACNASVPRRADPPPELAPVIPFTVHPADAALVPYWELHAGADCPQAGADFSENCLST